MPDTRLRLFITGDGSGLGSTLRKSGAAVNGFARNTLSAFKRVNSGIQGFADRHISGMASMLGGVGLGMAAKGIVDMKSRFARLRIEGRLTALQLRAIEQQVYAVAKATHQDPGDLLGAVEKIIEKTGNFKYAQKHIYDMGVVASATGAQLEYVGSTASDLDQKLKVGDKFMQAMDILKVQGKEGAFTLKELATQGSSVTSTAASMGMEGIRGVRLMGGFLQMFMQATRSPEQTTTAFAAMSRDIQENYKKIEKLGIKVWDEKKSKEQGKHVMRDAEALMTDLLTKTKGDVTILRKIFNEESWSGVQSLTRDGGLQQLHDLINKPLGDGAETMKDFNYWSEQTAAALTDMKTQAKGFANMNLGGPIKGLTGTLNFLNNHPTLTKGLMYAGTGLALSVGARKVWGMFRGGKAGLPGGIGGGGIPGFSGAQPVFVTNWPVGVGNIGGPYSPMGGGPDEGIAGGARKGARARALGRLGKMGKAGATLAGGALSGGALVTGGAVAGSAAIGYGIGTAINRYVLTEGMQDAIGKGMNWALQPFSQAARDAIAASRDRDRLGNMIIKIYTNERGQSIVDTEGSAGGMFKNIKVKRSSFVE